MRVVPASRFVAFFSIGIAGCLIDLATKSWMFNRLGMPGPALRTWWIWEDVFGFQTSLNEGALFGMGQGMVGALVALSVVAAGGVLFWLFYLGAARNWLLTISLGCIAAGIAGNLYDRLGLPGLKWWAGHPMHGVDEPVYAVRDWILVMIGSRPWPNFNIADSLLVCGVVVLAWDAFFFSRREPKPKEGTVAG
jgi:signal peptidase II